MSGLSIHIILCFFRLLLPEQLPEEGFSANHSADKHFDYAYISDLDSTGTIYIVEEENDHKEFFPVFKDSHVCYLQHIPLCVYCALHSSITVSILFESDTSPPAIIVSA
ncbi:MULTISPECIES: hypothetical protein [unclassified Saccharicrinis]|uniref:hypothetical protein n=1 Tax=unclassified Saccharicrinis TaxID=2646859 RepID=UPI003D33168F